MKQRLIKILALFCMCILVIAAMAQQSATLKETEAKIQLHKGLLFLTEGPAAFSLNDLDIIEAYNFETYRKEDTRLKIQLVKGPLIELLSKREQQASATNVPRSASSITPPGSPSSTTLHEIILELNIGLGYQKKQHTEVSN